MNLIFGIVVTALSWVACWELSSLTGLNLYVPMALAWALWAAVYSKRRELVRYERVFPLEPIALFVSILLAWPFALPWFLRLERKARLGQLQPSPRPSRTKYVLLAVAVAGSVAVFGGMTLMNHSGLFAPLIVLQQAFAHERAMNMNLSGGELTLSIPNSPIAPTDTAARHLEAYRLAAIAAQALDTFPTISGIGVRYMHVGGTAGLTITRSEDSYYWSMAELRASP